MAKIFKVRKSDGTIKTFEKEKIYESINKAVKAVKKNIQEEKIKEIFDKVIQNLESSVKDLQIPDTYTIYENIIKTLKEFKLDEVAGAYEKFRETKKKKKKVMVEVKDVMEEYLSQADWRVNENSNMNFSIGGLILKNSEKITANYWLSYVYPEEIGNAHRNGDFHIHDLGMFTPYCAGWSLRQLLEEGINGVRDKIASDPPKHLNAAVNQIVNFLGILQNEWAGAQAFSSLDTYLAPFVHKYEEELQEMIEKYGLTFNSPEAKQKFIDEKTYKYVKQCMQNMVFGLNMPSRWGTQTPFSNITLDLVPPADLKEKSLYLGGVNNGPYKKKFGELQKQMDMINKALIEVYLEGDKDGKVFTFPIPTYNITEDFDWNSEIANLLFEMTAKYGIPYFQNFIGSQYIVDENGNRVKDPKAFSPGDVRSMCCRLQLDLEELRKRGGGLFGSAEMTGSIGVVTINLPRIGYLYKGDKEGFKKRLRYLMDLAKESLEIKRKVVKEWMEKGLYPYTKRYLGSFRNHFSTIGINGMNESILNFTNGEHDITTPYGQEFAKEILDFMREILVNYQEETGNLYNLEATPAEGTSYRLAKEDIKQFPDIIHSGPDSAPYYTNSTWLPEAFTTDPFEALDLQDELQTRYTGGTVLHIYLGEKIDSDTAKELVKTIISRYRLPYVSITPTFSICPKHGYIPGERDYCPYCDAEIGYTGSKYDLETREKYMSNDQKLKKIKKLTFGEGDNKKDVIISKIDSKSECGSGDN